MVDYELVGEELASRIDSFVLRPRVYLHPRQIDILYMKGPGNCEGRIKVIRRTTGGVL